MSGHINSQRMNVFLLHRKLLVQRESAKHTFVLENTLFSVTLVSFWIDNRR